MKSDEICLFLSKIEQKPPQASFGNCGDDLRWMLLPHDTLLIMGSGPMWNYDRRALSWGEFVGQITAVAFLEGITGIGTEAFWGMKLVSLELPEGLEEIGELAFAHCESLKRIVFPRSLRRIGRKAFAHCSSLEAVTVYGGCEIAPEAFPRGVRMIRIN